MGPLPGLRSVLDCNSQITKCYQFQSNIKRKRESLFIYLGTVMNQASPYFPVGHLLIIQPDNTSEDSALTSKF